MVNNTLLIVTLILLTASSISFGYYLGINRRATKLDGELCIIQDQDEDHIFLRVRKLPDTLKNGEIVELSVFVGQASDFAK